MWGQMSHGMRVFYVLTVFSFRGLVLPGVEVERGQASSLPEFLQGSREGTTSVLASNTGKALKATV